MKTPDSGLKEQLQDLYWVKNLSHVEIGKILHVNKVTVWRKLKQFGIQLKLPPGKLNNVSREELVELYWTKELSIDQISRYYHVRQPTVRGRMEKLGIPFRQKGNPGSKNASWKGGVTFRNENGYVFVYLPGSSHFSSMRTLKSYVAEHRLVMAKHLDRPLESWEIVHHINGVKDDNRIENLHLFTSRAEHLPSIQMQTEINTLKGEVRLLKWQIKTLREEISNLKKEMTNARS